MRIALLILMVLNATFLSGSHAQAEVSTPIVIEIVPATPIKFRVGGSEFSDVELHQFLGKAVERFGNKDVVVVKLASSDQLYVGIFAANVAIMSYEKVYLALPTSSESQDGNLNILQFVSHDETTFIRNHLKARPAVLVSPSIIDSDPNGAIRRQLDAFDRLRQGLSR